MDSAGSAREVDFARIQGLVDRISHTDDVRAMTVGIKAIEAILERNPHFGQLRGFMDSLNMIREAREVLQARELGIFARTRYSVQEPPPLLHQMELSLCPPLTCLFPRSDVVRGGVGFDLSAITDNRHYLRSHFQGEAAAAQAAKSATARTQDLTIANARGKSITPAPRRSLGCPAPRRSIFTPTIASVISSVCHSAALSAIIHTTTCFSSITTIITLSQFCHSSTHYTSTTTVTAARSTALIPTTHNSVFRVPSPSQSPVRSPPVQFPMLPSTLPPTPSSPPSLQPSVQSHVPVQSPAQLPVAQLSIAPPLAQSSTQPPAPLSPQPSLLPLVQFPAQSPLVDSPVKSSTPLSPQPSLLSPVQSPAARPSPVQSPVSPVQSPLAQSSTSPPTPLSPPPLLQTSVQSPVPVQTPSVQSSSSPPLVALLPVSPVAQPAPEPLAQSPVAAQSSGQLNIQPGVPVPSGSASAPAGGSDGSIRHSTAPTPPPAFSAGGSEGPSSLLSPLEGPRGPSSHPQPPRLWLPPSLRRPRLVQPLLRLQRHLVLWLPRPRLVQPRLVLRPPSLDQYDQK
ncbi:flocculation protein FLO11-like [Oreochromis niloticus]|uniref:flocculation protein FLO11-like n=1 Tax=Oreochromis niloticus TaxID=8128 RepID=UPI000904D965|nr:flocculation protein FLO11-like [Oreochromis niloticus]